MRRKPSFTDRLSRKLNFGNVNDRDRPPRRKSLTKGKGHLHLRLRHRKTIIVRIATLSFIRAEELSGRQGEAGRSAIS